MIKPAVKNNQKYAVLLLLWHMASANATNVPGKRARSSPDQSMSSKLAPASIVWYRDFDLRLRDHQPLTQAARLGCVIPVFIWPSNRGPLAPGGAAQVPQSNIYIMPATAIRSALHIQFTCVRRLGSRNHSIAWTKAFTTSAAGLS